MLTRDHLVFPRLKHSAFPRLVPLRPAVVQRSLKLQGSNLRRDGNSREVWFTQLHIASSFSKGNTSIYQMFTEQTLCTRHCIQLFVCLFGHAYSIQKFPGQGLNPCHSNDNAKSLTCWATRELLHSIIFCSSHMALPYSNVLIYFFKKFKDIFWHCY